MSIFLNGIWSCAEGETSSRGASGEGCLSHGRQQKICLFVAEAAGQQGQKLSLINLVDLAGSEKATGKPLNLRTCQDAEREFTGCNRSGNPSNDRCDPRAERVSSEEPQFAQRVAWLEVWEVWSER